MNDGAAWFIDGAYLYKVWQSLKRNDRLDYLKLRQIPRAHFCRGHRRCLLLQLRSRRDEREAKRLPQCARLPPPDGPGIRVKLYWLQKRPLFWPTSWGGGPVIHPESARHFELIQQKAVDVGLAFHLMRSHSHRKWRTLFLAAGDSDFHEVVQHLVENEDVQLILIGSDQTISGELLSYARAVVKVRDIADELART